MTYYTLEPYSDNFEAAIKHEWEHEYERARDFLQWMWPRSYRLPDGATVEAFANIMVAFAKQEVSRQRLAP